jgi:hypothetical protein
LNFSAPRQIRVPRARRGQRTLRILGPFGVFHRQRFFPILPVAILDAQRDRSADRFSVAHACENFRLVLFDPLPRSAPVTQLSSVQLALNEFLIYRHARRHPGDPRH